MSDRDRDRDSPLPEAVFAVADGEPVDWELALRAAQGDDEREQLAALRAIERIRLAFSTWHTEGGAEDRALDSALAPGARWGDLEILDRVGRGSFGDVYRARDPHLDRQVALKLLRRVPRTPSETPEAEATRVGVEQRAVREGQLLARVRHENVVTVFGAARHDGRVGLWMEFLEGKTLADLLREQGPSSAREAAGVGIDVCRALAAVHAEGILHRDVKAQNVMRAARGRIVLTDFGIGRELGAASREETTSLSGTPLYLAPEVLAGEAPSIASDLYAVGVLLFHLATGDFPVHGGSLRELREAHERGDARLLRDIRPDLPRGFVEVVERALAADPNERPRSAGAFERALAAWAGAAEQTESEKNVATVLSTAAPNHGSARLWLGWVVASAAVLATLALAALLWHSRDPATRAQKLLARALTQQDRGETEDALRSLDLAIDVSPHLAEAWMRKSQFLSGSGRFAEALAALDQAHMLETNFEPAKRHAFRGLYFIYRMRYAEAIQEYAKAIDLDPQDNASRRELALAYANLGEYEKALNAARMAARSDPESVLAAGLVPIFLASLGRSTEALAELEAFKTRLGSQEYFSWGEGLAYAGRGEYGAAENAFRTLAASNDKDFATYGRLLRAQVRILSGDLGGAREILELGSGADLRERNDRNEVNTRIQLAGLALRSGEMQQADGILHALVRDLRDVPIQLKPLRDAALLAVETGDLALATRLARRVGKIATSYPSDLGTAFEMQIQGEILLRQGAQSAARGLLEESFRHRPDLSIRLSLAKAWGAEGNCMRASELLDELEHARGRAVREYSARLWEERNDELRKCSPK